MKEWKDFDFDVVELDEQELQRLTGGQDTFMSLNEFAPDLGEIQKPILKYGIYPPIMAYYAVMPPIRSLYAVYPPNAVE